jgi:DNA-binding XRE family transcriptional regulator
MNITELRVERFRHGVTQEDMAKILGVSATTYVRREAGFSEFNRKEIEQIAKLFNLSIERVNEIFFNSELTERTN